MAQFTAVAISRATPSMVPPKVSATQVPVILMGETPAGAILVAAADAVVVAIDRRTFGSGIAWPGDVKTTMIYTHGSIGEKACSIM